MPRTSNPIEDLPSRDPVNETHEQTIGRLEAQNAHLLSQLSTSEIDRDKYQRASVEAERKVLPVGRDSRIQKIFLAIVQGFAANGSLNQTTLAARPGSETGIFKHAAGLAEVAYKQTEGRFGSDHSR